ELSYGHTVSSAWEVTILIVVTCHFEVKLLFFCSHGSLLPAKELSCRAHPRHGRRALDDPDSSRLVPEGAAALPGFPGLARRRRAEHALRAPQGPRGGGLHRAQDL